MHRGNVAGDGTKANFHLFKLGWRESERKPERKLWCFENDNNNLKVSLRRECAPTLPYPVTTTTTSLSMPCPLLFCPLPLNTTAQWVSGTRWAVGMCYWEGQGAGGKFWHLKNYLLKKHKDEKKKLTHYLRLQDFCEYTKNWIYVNILFYLGGLERFIHGLQLTLC